MTLYNYLEAIKSVEANVADFKDQEIRDAANKLQTVLARKLAEFIAQGKNVIFTDEELYQIKRPNREGKISAIKSVRERTGMGLAEAKMYVEREAQKLGYFI